METVNVNAVLSMTFIYTGKTVTLINDELSVPVEGDRIGEGEAIEEIADQMALIAKHSSEGQPHKWTLLMAYEGRCWYLEKDTDAVELGYYDVGTVEGWCAIAGS